MEDVDALLWSREAAGSVLVGVAMVDDDVTEDDVVVIPDLSVASEEGDFPWERKE